MSERDKIEQVIEKYRDLFDGEDGMDVAISVKGEFFFYTFSREYDYYDHFVKFNTAEELEKLIIGNVVDDANCILEPLVDELEMQGRNVQEAMTEGLDFTEEVVKMSMHLETLERVFAENNDVLRILVRGMKNLCDRIG